MEKLHQTAECNVLVVVLPNGKEVSVLKVRIKFRKYGVMKFIGHLDVMRYFQKVMRRAEIPIAFTQGFSPHMIMSFAQPLGIGITSDGEYLDIELKEPIASKKAVSQLNAVMVEGMDVVSFVQISEDKKESGMTITAAADYRVYLLESNQTSDLRKAIPAEWQNAIPGFLAQEQIVVWKKTKRSEKEVDIKPMIYDMKADNDSIYLFLATGSEQNLKPDLVMDTFLKYMGLNPEETPLHYHRLDVYARSEEKLVPLEALGKEISESI
jgi:radical SAM-linked protein